MRITDAWYKGIRYNGRNVICFGHDSDFNLNKRSIDRLFMIDFIDMNYRAIVQEDNTLELINGERKYSNEESCEIILNVLRWRLMQHKPSEFNLIEEDFLQPTSEHAGGQIKYFTFRNHVDTPYFYWISGEDVFLDGKFWYHYEILEKEVKDYLGEN